LHIGASIFGPHKEVTLFAEIISHAVIRFGWATPYCIVYILAWLIAKRASNVNDKAKRLFSTAFLILFFNSILGAVSDTFQFSRLLVVPHNSIVNFSLQMFVLNLIPSLLNLFAWIILLLALDSTFPKSNP